MRYLRNFMLAMLLIFIGIALAASALAQHTVLTSNFWLVTIDYDARGLPSVSRNPMPRIFRSAEECSDVGQYYVNAIKQREPDRRFATVCLTPDDEDDIMALVEEAGNYFSQFFSPLGQGA